MLDVLRIALTGLFFGVNVAFAAGRDRLTESAVQTGYRRYGRATLAQRAGSAIAAMTAQGVFHKGCAGAEA